MKTIYKPRGIDKADRLARFDQMNRWVTSRGGWVVSLPGDEEMRVECLPGSSLPDELAAAGYDVDKIGEGERILPAAIVQKFMLGKGGALVPWVEGKPVASTVTHAGITKIERYGFAFAGADLGGKGVGNQ